MALDHSCQVQRHPLAERGHDLYETPDVAVEALLRVERLPHRIWEPAAGRGAIVRVLLRRAGHAVIASDVADYGFPLDFVRDFLTETGCRTEPSVFSLTRRTASLSRLSNARSTFALTLCCCCGLRLCNPSGAVGSWQGADWRGSTSFASASR